MKQIISAYMRIVYYNKYLVRLLMAKNRAAPKNPTTILRLKLCGAVIGTRLHEKVMSSLQTRVVVWTRFLTQRLTEKPS